MNHKRKKTYSLRSVAQLRVVSSPQAFEILEALQLGGPASVGELGPRLGRRANSLHYHVRKLEALGLVEGVGTNRKGARTEVIYDVVADQFVSATVSKEREQRDVTSQAVASMLRLASRDFTRAAEEPTAVSKGRGRNLLARRKKARLSSAELAKLNRHLDAIDKIFAENCGAEKGTVCVLTAVLTSKRTPEMAPE